MRPKKLALYFLGGLVVVLLLWKNFFAPTPLPQTQNTVTPAVAKQLLFTESGFPYSEVKRGEELTFVCNYNNTLGFAPTAKARIWLVKLVDKSREVIYEKDIAISQGLGTLSAYFSIPETTVAGEYEAAFYVYLMPGDTVEGGCITSKFSII